MNTRLNATRLAYLLPALLALVVLLLVSSRSFDFGPLVAALPLAAEPFAGAAAPAAGVQFSVPAGRYENALDIRLSTAHPDAQIYFTIDGSLPTAETGTLYTGPIHLPADPPRVYTLRASAVLPSGELGPVANATYFIDIDASMPLLSLTIDPLDLWDEESGIYANPQNRGIAWERPAALFYYDPQKQSGVAAPVGVRIHGAASRLYEKKPFRLYFRDDYGLSYLEYPLFPDTEKALFKRLVLHSGGQDLPAVKINGTLLRNELSGILARQAGAYATYSRPVLLFINGEGWGLYNIRERIDRRYLEETFQIANADLLSGFERRLEAVEGDTENWDHLVGFYTANDLTDADNYAYIQTQVNLDNLIDYALIQFITANADWPHNNQLKFRDRAGGRWHWMLWDSDYAFGLMPDSYAEKNMVDHLLHRESNLLLSKLLENPQFKNRFLGRLAELLNGVYSSQNMLAELDRLSAVIEDDIDFETRRWPGSGNWAAGVETMRDFARRRPAIVREHTIEAFDLPGTAGLTINRPSADHGAVSINGGTPLAGEDLPWQGIYFQGIPLQLVAIPDPGYRFAGWQSSTPLPQNAALTTALDADLSLTPIFVKDDGSEPPAGSVVFSGFGKDGDAPSLAGLEGAWITLQVRAPTGVDLRGWRITDKDSPASADEGSLILGDHPGLARVPPGVTILLALSQTPYNDHLLREDDLGALDGRLVLYAGNDVLDTHSDPWFNPGENEILSLLAPGTADDTADDVLIDTMPIQ